MLDVALPDAVLGPLLLAASWCDGGGARRARWARRCPATCWGRCVLV